MKTCILQITKPGRWGMEPCGKPAKYMVLLEHDQVLMGGTAGKPMPVCGIHKLRMLRWGDRTGQKVEVAPIQEAE